MDVRQAALLQTGRTVRDGRYAFDPYAHYVGPVRIMGFSHPNNTSVGGEEVSEAYLRYLALLPATAKLIATTLATRFVSDTPPQSIVDRLSRAYLRNQGAIRPLLTELFSSSEFWGAVGQKVRRPLDYVVATYRVLGVGAQGPAGQSFERGLRELRAVLDGLGHAPLSSPARRPEVFVAWSSAGTLVGLWNEALTAIEGGRPGFSYPRKEQLVARAPTTAAAYLDALALRLVHQTPTARQRDLILGIAGLAPAARVDATFNGAIAAVARALLASPMHHLR